jgi:hypothetical protein
VKGFTEALINDLKLNAPHLKCSVVMPGHIGTDIAINSRLIISGSEDTKLSDEALKGARAQMQRMGVDVAQVTDAQIQAMVDAQGQAFRDNAPTSAAQAAKIILDGVRSDSWRILVGDDAQRMDEMVRSDPAHAYEPGFFQRMTEQVGWQLGGGPARQ